jgi:hypothetical protein
MIGDEMSRELLNQIRRDFDGAAVPEPSVNPVDHMLLFQKSSNCSWPFGNFLEEIRVF